MELNTTDKQALLQRFPHIELSYETVSHKKVSGDYDLGMAISVGKKYYAWFTFSQDRDVCYLMELNKDKKISRIFETQSIFHSGLCLGTVFYGTVAPAKDGDTAGTHACFVLEDVYYYKGIHMKGLCFGEKLHYLKECFHKYMVQAFGEASVLGGAKHHTIFALPMMWHIANTHAYDYAYLPEAVSHKIGYAYHHIQYRALGKIAPYLNQHPSASASPPPPVETQSPVHTHNNNVQPLPNLPINGYSVKKCTGAPNVDNSHIRSSTSAKSAEPIFHIQPERQMPFSTVGDCSSRRDVSKPHFMDFSKPQYKHPAVFRVCADLQYDIYHLYAFGKNKTQVYYNVAYIPNYKTSVFMNSLFRNVRENTNLDYIEESEDEDDFENLDEDKYVDLEKMLNVECVFHPKFKKWTPIRVVGETEKIVHIIKL